MDAGKIYDSVRDRYTAVAHISDPGYSHSVARSFGYTEEELASIPRNANLGLSCGNPTAMASLREGEIVVDMGSGAGLDVFLASGKVGPTGTVYGVDMNKDMIARANETRAQTNNHSVSFVEARMTDVPLDSAVADCVMSNCAVNLVPAQEKQLAFSEMFRLLKPGGRLAISDLLLKQALPEKLRSCVTLYTACIAGASQVSEYETYLRVAGFEDVLITDRKANLNVYLETGVDSTSGGDFDTGSGGGCCGSAIKGEKEGQSCAGKNVEGDSGRDGQICLCCGGRRPIDLNELAGSYQILAVKR